MPDRISQTDGRCKGKIDIACDFLSTCFHTIGSERTPLGILRFGFWIYILGSCSEFK